MSKRNLKIIETEESKLLKKMRIEAGLSVRKLAELMGISHTRVYQMESGREKISIAYLEKVKEVTGIIDTSKNYPRNLGIASSDKELLKECISMTIELDLNKLRIIKLFIEQLNS